MRIFKNAWFERFARKNKISNTSLREAIERANKGHVDAVLGSGVIKQRIARQGQGRSAGFRSVIFYQAHNMAVFVYAFAKSDRSNISTSEEVQFRKSAVHILKLSEQQLAKLISIGQFTEVNKDD